MIQQSLIGVSWKNSVGVMTPLQIKKRLHMPLTMARECAAVVVNSVHGVLTVHLSAMDALLMVSFYSIILFYR